MMKLEKIVVLQALKRDGLSISAFARRTGMDRKTVRKLLGQGIAAPAYSPREPRLGRLEQYEGYLEGKNKACPELEKEKPMSPRDGRTRKPANKVQPRHKCGTVEIYLEGIKVSCQNNPLAL